MENNHFKNAPTVGSNDNCESTSELYERIRQLEARIAEEQHRRENESRREAEARKKSPKKWYKKITKFVKEIFVPVVNAISRFMNIIFSFKKARYA